LQLQQTLDGVQLLLALCVELRRDGRAKVRQFWLGLALWFGRLWHWRWSWLRLWRWSLARSAATTFDWLWLWLWRWLRLRQSLSWLRIDVLRLVVVVVLLRLWLLDRLWLRLDLVNLGRRCVQLVSVCCVVRRFDFLLLVHFPVHVARLVRRTSPAGTRRRQGRPWAVCIF
jgi:hypothetical protein